jgi:hypothetical protein
MKPECASMTRLNRLALAFFWLAAGAAQAADKPEVTHSLVLSHIDTDGGGKISLDEAKAAAEAKFKALDLDHDGKLDAVELTGVVGSKSIAKSDTDKDGTLDKAEYIALTMRHFNKADTDHSGKLDGAELDAEPGRDLISLLQY